MKNIKIKVFKLEEINSILNDENKKVIEVYLELQKYYENKFGKNVIILYELGSFYEVYQVGDEGKAIEVSQTLNILLTKKNKKIDQVDMSNPFMCGLPSIKVEKYIDILLKEDKYTIIVIKQVRDENNNITRKIDKIISSGTNLETNSNKINNYITSLVFEKASSGIIIGSASYIDVSSGNVFCYEIYGTPDDKELSIDEIYKLFNTYTGKEVIINFDGFEDYEEKLIINKLNLDNKSFVSKKLLDNKTSLNLVYQNKLLNSIYAIKTMLTPIEYFNMETYTNMSTSLTLLLEFIIEHNNSIVFNLKEPIIISNEKYLMMGNNAAEQLELVSTGNNKGLIEILTKGCSTYGKRFINQRLLNPILNRVEIERRYDNSFKFVDFKDIDKISSLISNIHDLERLFRKILVNTIQPFELYSFYESLNNFFKIYKIVSSDANLKTLDFIENIDLVNIIKIYKQIETTFKLDLIQIYSLNSINNSFIKEGISKDLDDTIIEHNKLFKEIEELANVYLKLIDDKKEFDLNDTVVKLNNNDTEGYFFTITKKRYDTIKDKLENQNFILNKNQINLKNDFEYKHLVGTIKITSEKLSEVSNLIETLKDSIINKNIEIFNNFINDIFQYKNDVNNLIISLGELEFSILNANLYNSNAYCKPEILNLGEDNFYEAIELRHPIIERIENKGLFVPNNMVIGKKEYISENNSFIDFYKEKNTEEINGVMLYGLNSSGKSVNMKSIGLSIALAQAGMFVPAKALRYTIYDSIFTRITGRDDIYRGLSSFAVEMLELKNIFNRVNKKSLVLGDEISHGTETISGMSIVASTVINLIKKNFHFVFATHLHQLNDLEEIKSLDRMINLHLAVKYDEQNEKFIYNRKLAYGSGSSVYGLEFAKFLKMDKDFLKVANDIRMKIADDLTNVELLSKKKSSSYNKNVFFTQCVFCNNKATEIHHIKEQQNAKNGIIDGHRLNHEFNLVPLCQKHHDIVHKYQDSSKEPLLKYIQTSDGVELEVDQILLNKL